MPIGRPPLWENAGRITLYTLSLCRSLLLSTARRTARIVKRTVVLLSLPFSALVATVAIYSATLGFLVDATDLSLLSGKVSLAHDRATISIFAIAAFGVILFGSWEILSEYRDDRNLWRRIHSTIKKDKQGLLEDFILFHSESEPNNTAHLVTWRGYEELLYPLQLRLFMDSNEQPISLRVLDYESSDIFRYLAGDSSLFRRLALRRGIREANSPEFLILDYEVFELIRNNELRLPLRSVPAPVAEKIKHKIHRHVSKQFSRNDEFLGLPICFDVNAIAFNRTTQGSASASTLRNLLSHPEQPETLGHCRNIGILDWYLPILGLFALTINRKNPFHLKVEEFDQLRQKLDIFTEVFTKRRNISIQLFSAEDLVVQLLEGSIDVAVGGGSWIGYTGPSGPFKHKQSDLAWVLPEAGGLLWTEAIVAMEHGDRDPRLAIEETHTRTVFDYFLENRTHNWLSTKRICSGLSALKEHPRPNTCVTVVADDLSETTPLEYITQEVGHRIFPRSYPPAGSSPEGAATRDQWEHLWSHFRAHLSRTT